MMTIAMGPVTPKTERAPQSAEVDAATELVRIDLPLISEPVDVNPVFGPGSR